MIDRRAHRCDIYKVARQCGVILRDGHLHSPTSRKPFECYCKPTVRYIGQQHGEEHLKLVFMLMTGTKNNAAELYADMMTAVSVVLSENQHLIKSPTLAQDFDAMDLGRIRREAKTMRLRTPNWSKLGVLILLRLNRPRQGDLLDMIGEAA